MPSTHVNANKENVVVVVVVVVIWLKRRVPILSVAIMSGAWAPTVSFRTDKIVIVIRAEKKIF